MLLMKDIVREGNDVLRKVTDEVTFPLSDETKKLAEDMMTFLKNSQNPELAKKHQLRPGVGLAANQVGVSKAMSAVLIPDADDNIIMEEMLINPKVIRQSVRKVALGEGEGCLSVDRNVPGYVPRANKITIRYQNMDGEFIEKTLKGYEAIVCQHEIDHLNGHLFYDRINQENPFFVETNMLILE
ncbi:peptide deformylase [Holzapfeliella floricola]|uniref:Peptide deformylase n=1 Tax=Holzapfeliella floricola DSM 23037 = JCM 16512 TaxID=1423744 RepID=A0A0R2DT11_9LACO|nr:peptide deformylase [Holzapfeliella floricola]KRN03612.1 peptide deformylase [Holzapfeliella floricola DSM 23037 = JCM 16512]